MLLVPAAATWAAGNLVTNAPDLARFFRALLRGRLLAPDSISQAAGTLEGALAEALCA